MSEPLRRIRFETSSPEAAHEYTRTRYAEHTLHLPADRQKFHFSVTGVADGGFSVEQVSYATHGRAVSTPIGRLCVLHVLDGGLRVTIGKDDLVAGPGDIALLDPLAATTIDWDRLRAGVVCLEPDDVAQIAGETSGIDPAELRFELSRPMSDGLARYWQSVVRHVTQDVLGSQEVSANAVALAESMRMLAVAALQCFPNSSLDMPAAIEASAPAAVRRAIEFIDSHAGEPITLTDISAAARIAPRSLQAAFRRHLDTTPTTYLRRARLAGAHRDLQGADPTTGATVAAIARRWGFTQLGRFAGSYRSTYGRTPSRTLHD